MLRLIARWLVVLVLAGYSAQLAAVLIRRNESRMPWACYLYFSVESEGTLFSKWNETPLDNALAFFVPDAKAKVPKYLTSNGGKRLELVRNISASRIKEYYRGYATFIKSANKFNSTVTNNDTDGGSEIVTILAYLSLDEEVYFPANGESVLVTEFVAVAVLNKANNILKGVKKTTKGQFVDKVNQNNRAYAIRFDR